MNLEEILKDKEKAIAMKKSTMKMADAYTSNFITTANKSIAKSENTGTLNKTFVGNTYNWMDSHDDVHVGNTFAKSIKENKNIFHLHDHEFKTVAIVGDIDKIEEQEVSWKSLGVNKSGNTTSLVINSNIKKAYNEKIYERYLTNKINQHSVGMHYVKIDLAVNDESMNKEYEVWNKYIDVIGNKEKALEKGYFWAVKEAKLVEVSAVLLGSNELTGIIEPSNDTQKSNEHTHSNEPSLNEIIKQIKL